MKRYSENDPLVAPGLETITSDYDDVLAGKSDAVSIYAFYTMTPGGTNERLALDCIRYAIEEILEWTPEEAIQKFDDYMLKTMKLERVAEFVRYPVEVDGIDMTYLLSRLYPYKIRVTQEKLIANAYERILKEPGRQFPREYFAGGEGFHRFCYCLKHAVENYTVIDSTEKMYRFFTSPRGRKFLYDARLRVPADQFAISMLDVIHYVTKKRPDSDMWYSYFTFMQEIKKIFHAENQKDSAQRSDV
jgi:hypothetical protein